MDLDEMIRLAMTGACIACNTDLDNRTHINISRCTFIEGKSYIFTIGEEHCHVDVNAAGFTMVSSTGTVAEFHLWKHACAGTMFITRTKTHDISSISYQLEVTDHKDVLLTTSPAENGAVEIICVCYPLELNTITNVGNIEMFQLHHDDSNVLDHLILGRATPYLLMLFPWAIQSEDVKDDTMLLENIMGIQNKNMSYVVLNYRGMIVTYRIRYDNHTNCCYVKAMCHKGSADYWIDQHKNWIQVSGRVYDKQLNGLLRLKHDGSVSLFGNAPEFNWMRSRLNICGITT